MADDNNNRREVTEGSRTMEAGKGGPGEKEGGEVSEG